MERWISAGFGPIPIPDASDKEALQGGRFVLDLAKKPMAVPMAAPRNASVERAGPRRSERERGKRCWLKAIR